MGSRWLDERRRDPYYKDAKKQGYRARSAFKLKQMQDRYHLVKTADAVIDLGCAPGGWSQVLVELVGDRGLVLGVDLIRTRPVDGATFIRGDFTKESTRDRLSDLLSDQGRTDVDVIVSDMAPDMSGTYSLDQARSVHLCSLALDFCAKHLKPGGIFVTKVFEGADFHEFREDVRRQFKTVRMAHPPASRKASSEVYLIAKGHRPVPKLDEEE